MLKCNNMYELATGFKHFANELVHKVQPKIDPNGEETMERVEALEAACDEIIAKERESMRLEHTGDEPTPMITRIILWFMCLGYFLYAWNLQNVRESLGVNPHAGDTRVDAFQRALATLCMMSTSLLVITGKKN